MLPGKPTIDELPALEPGSDLDALIEWSNEQDGSDVCWVGHSPDVEDLAAALIGDGGAPHSLRQRGRRCDRVSKARSNAGAGELYWLATAKLLGV